MIRIRIFQKLNEFRINKNYVKFKNNRCKVQ
jgi:hypothetical protein